MALSESGECLLWQMDEPHRVYQRALLLSPGRNYADILGAAQQFRHHLQQAYQALARQEFLESYRHLQRGRKVPGFGHQGAALDFSWQRLESLRRDRLEAVWERLSLEGPQAGDVDLHPELPNFLFSFGAKASLAVDQAGTARVLWTLPGKGRLCLLRFLTTSEGKYVLAADSGGKVGLHDPMSGRLEQAISLPDGPLSRVLLHGSTLTFCCQQGGLGQYDLNTRSTLFRDDLKIKPLVVGFWQRGKVLVATSAHLAVIDLSKQGSKPQALNLGVGLTATRAGHLYFWDLLSGDLLDSITAHRSGIFAMRTSYGGRYLLTAGADSVRYWETSWLYGDVRP